EEDCSQTPLVSRVSANRKQQVQGRSHGNHRMPDAAATVHNTVGESNSTNGGVLGDDRNRLSREVLVPGGGVEPPRPEGRRILSPLRLPVPPSRRGKLFYCTAAVANFEYVSAGN